MSKQNQREKPAAMDERAGDPHYQYRWSYAGQLAYEEKRDRKGRRRGAAIYTVTMALAFLCCFAILGGVLVGFDAEAPSGGNASLADAAARILPTTVLISCETEEGYRYGTGFFVRQDGYIATNYHVIAGQENILVTLYGTRQTLPAKVVGYSVEDDLAVLRIAGNHPVATLGSSESLRVGDVTVAVGNPSGPGGAWTTTSGIISATDRTVTVMVDGMIVDMFMLQTDAALNSGNSGGPLCNEWGEVIGIVTRKYSDNEGISLAIPIDGATPLINALIEKGSLDGVSSTVSRSRPMLGITAMTVKKGDEFYATVTSSYLPQERRFIAACDGVAILTVDETVPAAQELQIGDVILAVDGVPAVTVEQLTELMYEYRIGDTAILTLNRNGKTINVSCRFRVPR